MKIYEEAKLCWSLCSSTRERWPSADHMFRASLLHAETKSERIRRALETAFDTERLVLTTGGNGRPNSKDLRARGVSN